MQGLYQHGDIMRKRTIKEEAAERTGRELRSLAAYLDDHDSGRMPVNAGIYQLVSQQIKVLLAPHMTNPRIQRLCHRSQSLHEILGNLLIEMQPEMALDLRSALEEAKISASWLR
jgi:hypothetical protein